MVSGSSDLDTMHIRQTLQTSATATFGRAKQHMLASIQRAFEPFEPEADVVLDLTADDHLGDAQPAWAERPEDLTDDFDDKLADFMAYEDVSSERLWLLSE